MKIEMQQIYAAILSGQLNMMRHSYVGNL